MRRHRRFSIVSIIAMIFSIITLLSLTAQAEGNVVAAFEGNEYTVAVGKQITVTPVIQNYWGEKTITYASSDESIATVSSWGSVTGVSAGNTTILCTVKCGDKEFNLSYNLVVTQLIKSLKFEESRIVLCTNEVYTPQVIIEPENATNTTLLFELSDSSVAYLLDDCSLQGRYIGQCTLTVTAQDGSGVSARVTVEVPMVTVSETNIVIDTPEGVDFTYCLNSANLNSVRSSSGTTGDCFTTGYIKSVYLSETAVKKGFGGAAEKYAGEVRYLHLLPLKPGYGSYVFTINGSSVSVPVQVTRNAGYEERQYSYFTQWCNGEGLRYSVNGTIQNIEYSEITDENGESCRLVQFTLLMEDKLGQYAICSMSEQKLITSQENNKKGKPIVIDELLGKSIVFRGVYEGLVDYTAPNGLYYSAPSFTGERWGIQE